MKLTVQVLVHPDDAEGSPEVRDVFSLDRDDLAPDTLISALATEAGLDPDLADLLAGRGDVLTGLGDLTQRWLGTDGLVTLPGTGLPDEDLARAATRFWRAHNDGAGTGLGLAIAAEITAGHGGTIAVEKAPEGGLLVRYSLPPASETT